jgi:hypothetical protein
MMLRGVAAGVVEGEGSGRLERAVVERDGGAGVGVAEVGV